MSNYEVLEAFVALRREVALIRSAAMKDSDFGHNQIAFLHRLSVSSATMGELSEYSLTDKASTTRTISLLEKKGYVKRCLDQTDRRVVHIQLTAAGRDQSKKALAIRNAIASRLNENLTEAEQKQFAKLVRKMVQAR